MRELVLHCYEAQAEALADALLDAGVLSVSVEDADAGSPEEQALYGEPGDEPELQAWRRNRVVSLLPDGADPALMLTQALAESGLPETLGEGWSLRDVPDADWVRLTQSQFGPIEVSPRLRIVPSWCMDSLPAPAAASDPHAPIIIQLDPGLAFGTGSHPTTHLCLNWLEAGMPAGATVLDYGCGSGILAIAARKLGAGPVIGIDIDPQAVETTAFNANVNAVELQAGLPEALPDGVFDVVVANILSNPLKVLAPMLCGRVARGGHLVLSGVLARQAEEVIAAYAPWMTMAVWRALDGWVCLHGQAEQAACAHRPAGDGPAPGSGSGN